MDPRNGVGLELPWHQGRRTGYALHTDVTQGPEGPHRAALSGPAAPRYQPVVGQAKAAHARLPGTEPAGGPAPSCPVPRGGRRRGHPQRPEHTGLGEGCCSTGSGSGCSGLSSASGGAGLL